jgi:DNA-binding HxlR family transcriptional regulator
MSNTDNLYTGCPVQHARQFLAGKWQMGILWNLKHEARCFSALKNLLPGISDKIIMQELDFFVSENIICRNTVDFPSPKTQYTLSPTGRSLIPVINAIVEWGYFHLQDQQVTKEMSMTPLPAIEAIENSLAKNE